jgi:hypothetical protein
MLERLDSPFKERLNPRLSQEKLTILRPFRAHRVGLKIPRVKTLGLSPGARSEQKHPELALSSRHLGQDGYAMLSSNGPTVAGIPGNN